MAVPEADLTVLDSAARRPVGAKLGFCFSGGGVFFIIVVSVDVKASFWEGRGAAARFRGRGEILRGALRGRGE
jgi:hypothetical protein